MSVRGFRKLVTLTFRKYIRCRSTEAIKPVQQLSKTKPSTLDQKEIDHHGKLSEIWWDVNGEIKALHSFNPLRVQLIRDAIINTSSNEIHTGGSLKGINILDVGCGGGILSEPLARIGATVTGIDASPELINVAKTHAKLDQNIAGKLTYLNTSIEDHCKSNQLMYDVVVASEILEHVADQELFLKCCSGTLKPGGSILITTLNKTLFSWLGGIVIAEYICQLVPRATHDWKKFISPKNTQSLLEKCGCRTKLIHGIFYNPLKNEWCWSNSTSILYAIHAVKDVN